MAQKAFYAWQSDQNEDSCRYLIRDAAKRALKKLNADAKLSSAPAFELDHDTKDVGGHPYIAATVSLRIKFANEMLQSLRSSIQTGRSARDD